MMNYLFWFCTFNFVQRWPTLYNQIWPCPWQFQLFTKTYFSGGISQENQISNIVAMLQHSLFCLICAAFKLCLACLWTVLRFSANSGIHGSCSRSWREVLGNHSKRWIGCVVSQPSINVLAVDPVFLFIVECKAIASRGRSLSHVLFFLFYKTMDHC